MPLLNPSDVSVVPLCMGGSNLQILTWSHIVDLAEGSHGYGTHPAVTALAKTDIRHIYQVRIYNEVWRVRSIYLLLATLDCVIYMCTCVRR